MMRLDYQGIVDRLRTISTLREGDPTLEQLADTIETQCVPGPPWEYTSVACDSWQLHHLCNYFAEKGWEPVQVYPEMPSVRVPQDVRDPDGPRIVQTLHPLGVLFRRPAPINREEEV